MLFIHRIILWWSIDGCRRNVENTLRTGFKCSLKYIECTDCIRLEIKTQIFNRNASVRVSCHMKDQFGSHDSFCNLLRMSYICFNKRDSLWKRLMQCGAIVVYDNHILLKRQEFIHKMGTYET